MIIAKMEGRHAEQAAEIFVHRYKEARHHDPFLPGKYVEKEIVARLLEDMVMSSEGVVAIAEGEVIGYLAGFKIEDFKSSHCGVYTPEWAHGVSGENSDVVFEKMYADISSRWLQDGCIVHAITALNREHKLIEQLFWNGYGMHVVDSMREVQAVEKVKLEGIHIRNGHPEDVDQLVDLLEEHESYLASAPVFLPQQNKYPREAILGWFENPDLTVTVAEREDDIVAIMNTESGADNACTIVRDEKTLAIKETHTKAAFRGSGIGKALLNHVEVYAVKNGYERLSVDFESANLSARRFWMTHFRPVGYSLIRYLDDRNLSR